MAGQVHQHVDAISADNICDGVIIHRRDVPPDVRERTKPLGLAVGAGHVAVAIDGDLRTVVGCQ
jgi:hypothetical protein